MSTRHSASLMTVISVLAAIATAPSSAAATDATATPLVFSRSDLTTLGLRPARASAAGGRALLGAALAGRELSADAASAAGGGGKRLAFDAFILRSGADATHVLDAWRRSHHASQVAIGNSGAAFVTDSHRRSGATVLWRDGDRLGLVVLTLTSHIGAALQTAVGYAELAESQLSSALPTTAWELVSEQVRPNGSVSETTALESVALAFGPLPGVRIPAGAQTRVPSGTAAGAWVLAYLPRLKPRLRRAVYRDLGLAAPGAAAHTATFGDPGFHQSSSLTAAANRWAAVYADSAHLAHVLSLTIVAGTTTSPLKGADADAFPVNARGAYSAGGPYCLIRVAPSVARGSASFLSFVLAHEVFHCFEFDLDHNWPAAGPWVIEGMAEWAALSVDPLMSKTAEEWLLFYITRPHRPLFARTYDALGFWGHSADTAGSLWPKVSAILNAPSNAARFDDAGGSTTDFLTTWGSSPFRLEQGGPPWQMQSPEPVPLTYVDTPITDLDMAGGDADVAAAPYTTSQYVVDTNFAEPILLASIKGSARLSATLNYTDLSDAWFCTSLQSQCECPPGTTGEVPPTRPLPDGAALGLAGDPGTGTHGSLTTYKTSAFCRPTQQPSGTGTAGTGGDPHLIDFDGATYDFQAAGEFTLLKSTTDSLQIQIRQQPFPHSRSVAVNTAVAMRVGRAIVEVDSTSNNGVSVLVDHHRERAATTALAGGGRLTLTHSGLALSAGQTAARVCQLAHAPERFRAYCEQLVARFHIGTAGAEIQWPDGTSVLVLNGLTSANARTWKPALSIQIQVAHDRLKHLTGLLGDADVPSSEEFRSRNGRRFNATDILNGNFGSPAQSHVLYDEFGASWRITQRASLFTYARGSSTRSYTIRDFPSATFNPTSVPGSQFDQAAAICQAAGVTNQAVIQDCEYDVLATGNDGFAGGEGPLQTVENSYSPPPKTPTPPALHPIDLGTGDNQPRIAFDPSHDDTYVVWLDNSSSSIDVCTLTAAAPDCNGGSGPYKLVDALALEDGGNPTYFSPQVVVQPGGEAVVLAEADGVGSPAEPSGYGSTGAVAWSSAAGGAAFASSDQGIEDGGTLLASTGGAGDAPGNGAIALDDTDIGIYGDTYPYGSGFTDFAPGTPAPSTTPMPDSTGDYGDQLNITGNQLASIPDPSEPGEYIVVAVGADYGSPSGCPSGTSQATGYGVGIGTPTELQTQTAWGGSYFKPVSCQAFAPVLAGGGPAGGSIGMLDNEGAGLTGSGSDGVYYRAFSTTADSFGPPVLVSDETSNTLDGADDLSLSQDSAGGVYATWLDGRGWTLDYSTTPGSGWPAARATGLVQGAGSDAVVDGVGGGDAWLAYNYDPGSGTQEYVVPVSFSQLPP